jgi:hypothetical protein
MRIIWKIEEWLEEAYLPWNPHQRFRRWLADKRWKAGTVLLRLQGRCTQCRRKKPSHKMGCSYRGRR